MSIFHIVVILSVALASVAQMFLKKGASCTYSSLVREYLNPWVVCGYMLLFCSLLIDVWAIGRGVRVKEVSTIESLSYLFVPLLGYWLFGERITWRKAASVILIIAGVIVFFL